MRRASTRAGPYSSPRTASSSSLPLVHTRAHLGLPANPPPHSHRYRLPPLPLPEQHTFDLTCALEQDVPFSIRYRNCFRMALGDLPRNPGLVKHIRCLRADPVARAPVEGPFLGDYTVGTWNTQALFARDIGRYQAKMKYAHRLASRYNIMIWTETHGTADGNAAWVEPQAVPPGGPLGHLRRPREWASRCRTIS